MAKIIAILLLIIGLKFTQTSPLINPKMQQILIDNLRQKRQAPFDELIQSTLQLVRPIFGSAKTIAKSVSANQPQENPMMGKKPREEPRLSSARLRELEILGLGHNDEMFMAEEGTDLTPPICQGNSQICKFIACTAHNFKNDQNIANLQLATQLLADKKLRRTVGANSGAIGDVCREQGMSSVQCALFARSFQLIDRLMSTIEDQQEDGENANIYVNLEDDEQKNGQKFLKNENPHKNSTNVTHNKAGKMKPKIGTTSSSTTITTSRMRTTTTTALSNDRIFEPLDDHEFVSRPFPSTPTIPPSTGNIPTGSGSRTWSVQKHPPPPPLPPSNLSTALDNNAQQDEKKHKNRQQQIRRPPQPPNSPPRLLESAPVGQSIEIQRRLIRYSTVPMQMLHTDPDDGSSILISRTNMLKTPVPIPLAQTIPTAQKQQQEELRRPKQRFFKPISEIPKFDQQQISLQQRPIPQQIPMQLFPPIITSTATMMPKLTKITTTSMTIPEAEEFAEEDNANGNLELEMMNNELNNWMTRLSDQNHENDYYEDLEAKELMNKNNHRQNSNKSDYQKQNRTKNAGSDLVEDENEYLNDGGLMDKILPKSVGKVPPNSMMENCLQYLG